MNLRISLAIVVGFVWASQTQGQTTAGTGAKRPNVLFIAIDDLNDWTGLLGGHPQARTPNLDKLCRRGVLFDKAYCAAPACNPSRTALLTGLRPSTTGVYVNGQPWRPALPDVVTLLQYFMRHGYQVKGGGKIFHYNDLKSYHSYYANKDRFPKNKKNDLRGIGGNMVWGPLDVKDADMKDGDLTDWAIGQLRQKQEKPFFLAVGYYRPHLEWTAPRNYFDMHPLDKVQLPKVLKDDLADVPPAGIKMAKPQGDHAKIVKAGLWKEAVQAYLACSTFMDTQLGRLLAALADSPHAENTIIIVWSDHGWNHGQKEHWRKFALWEQTCRVVLSIHAPGTTRPDQRCPRPVNLLDVYPTLVELCGLPEKKGLDGHSLVPLLRTPQAEWPHLSLTTHGKDNHSLRNDRWRYIRYADGGEELYDHAADPLEWKNLASDPALAKVKAEMRKHLPLVNARPVPGAEGKKKKGNGASKKTTEPSPERAEGAAVRIPEAAPTPQLRRRDPARSEQR